MAQKNSKLGRVYVAASFNNTLVTVTDDKGDTLSWGSSGSVGFKGTRKATPFAATTAVEKVIKKAKEDKGIEEVEIYVKGPGPVGIIKPRDRPDFGRVHGDGRCRPAGVRHIDVVAFIDVGHVTIAGPHRGDRGPRAQIQAVSISVPTDLALGGR